MFSCPILVSSQTAVVDNFYNLPHSRASWSTSSFTKQPYPVRARQYIQNLREQRFGCTPGVEAQKDAKDEMFSNLIVGLVEDLQSEKHHFLFEIIQNAEDNSYAPDEKPVLGFYLLDSSPIPSTEADHGTLVVVNNELGFQEEHVSAICNVRKSTKAHLKDLGYIGEKGVGFKSVFMATHNPHIFSGGYQFAFHDFPDREAGLSHIWVSSFPQPLKQFQDKTCLVLPLRERVMNWIHASLDTIEPPTLLFLTKLSEILIQIPNKTISLIRDTSKAPLITLFENDTPSLYFVTKEAYDVPPHVTDQKRQNVKQRTITVALPLSAKVQTSVFAYLPTSMRSGFPFLINADFILVLSRQDMVSPSENIWNRWVLDLIPRTVASCFEQCVNTLSDFSYQCYQFLPASETHSHHFESTRKAILTLLKEKPLVITTGGGLQRGPKCSIIPEEFQMLFLDGQPSLAFDDVVHVKSLPYATQLQAIGVKPFTPEAFLTRISRNRSWILKQSPSWFMKLYSLLQKSPWASYRNLSPYLGSLVPLSQLSSSTGKIYLHDMTKLQWTNFETAKSVGLDLQFKLINRELYQMLLTDKSILSWVTLQLGVAQIETQEYCTALVNALSAFHQGAKITPQIIITHTRFLAGYAYYVQSSLTSKIPLLFQGNTMATFDQRPNAVLPLALSKVDWPQLYGDPPPGKFYTLLSDDYKSDTSEVNELLASFFLKTMKVPTLPPLIPKRCNSVRALSPAFAECFKTKLQQLAIPISVHDIVDFTFCDWELPDAFFKSPFHHSPQFPKTLLYWLNLQLKVHPTMGHANFTWDVDPALRCDRMRTTGKCHFGNTCHYKVDHSLKSIKAISSACRQLRHTKWFPSTQGIKCPKEVFLNEKRYTALFGSTIPYCAPDLPLKQAVIKFLKLDNAPAQDGFLALLESLSSQPIPQSPKDREQMTTDAASIYKILFKTINDETRSAIVERFATKPLIWGGNRWATNTRNVVWRDRSAAFGESAVFLEGLYGSDSLLKKFFTSVLKVANDASTTDVLNFLNHLRADPSFSNPNPVIESLLILQERKGDYPSIIARFDEGNFIFFPHTEQKWISKTDCLWEDHSAVLGEYCAYLSTVYPPALKDFFLQCAGIDAQASVSDLIKVLKQINVSVHCPHEQIAAIYSLLHQTDSIKDAQKIKKAFYKHKLIYIPGRNPAGHIDITAPGSWKTSERAVWEKPADLGNLLISPQEVYPSLKEFFLNKVSIPRTPDFACLAIVLANLKGDTVSNDQAKVVLSTLYSKLQNVPVDLQFWHNIRPTVRVLTEKDEWLPLDQVFWYSPTQFKLYELFKNHVPFIWMPVGQSVKRFSQFCFETLGVPDIKTHLNLTLHQSRDSSFPDPQNCLLTNEFKEFFLIQLWNDYPDIYEEIKSNGGMKRWLEVLEVHTSKIRVTYSLKLDPSIKVQLSKEALFLEGKPTERSEFYVSDSLPRQPKEHIREQFANEISQAIFQLSGHKLNLYHWKNLSMLYFGLTRAQLNTIALSGGSLPQDDMKFISAIFQSNKEDLEKVTIPKKEPAPIPVDDESDDEEDDMAVPITPQEIQNSTVPYIFQENSNFSAPITQSQAVKLKAIRITGSKAKTLPDFTVIPSQMLRLYGPEKFLMVQFDPSPHSGPLPKIRPGYFNMLFGHTLSYHTSNAKFKFLGFTPESLQENFVFYYQTGGDGGLPGTSPEAMFGIFGDLSSAQTPGETAIKQADTLYPSFPTIEVQPDMWTVNSADSHGFQYNGCGFIALDLAKKIGAMLHLPENQNCPGAFRIRLGEYTGMVVVDPKLSGRIILHESMKSYTVTGQRSSFQKVLCVMDYPKYGGNARLNRHLLLTLESLGVPRQVFLQLLDKHVRNLGVFFSDPSNYEKIAQRELKMQAATKDPNSIEQTLAERFMELYSKRTKTGTEKDDLRKCISGFFQNALLELRDSLEIDVPDSSELFGVIDPSLTLRPGQVFVRVNGKTLTGSLLVSPLNPLLPEEIRKLQAVDISNLSHLDNLIVFSRKDGAHDFYDAGGNHLNGTKYWVCWFSDIVKDIKKNRPAASFDSSSKPVPDISQGVTTKDICEATLTYMFDTAGIKERIRLLLIAHAERSGINSAHYLTLVRLYRLTNDALLTGQNPTLPPEIFEIEFPSYLGIKGPTYSPDTTSGDLYLACNMHIRRIGCDPKPPVVDLKNFFPLVDTPGDFLAEVEQQDVKRPLSVLPPPKKSVVKKRYRLPYEIGTSPVHHAFTLEEARKLEELCPPDIKKDSHISAVVDYEKSQGRCPIVIAQPGIDIVSFGKDALFDQTTESDQIRIRVKSYKNMDRRFCDKFEYFLALEYEQEYQIYVVENNNMTIFKNIADRLADREFKHFWMKKSDHVVQSREPQDTQPTKRKRKSEWPEPNRPTKRTHEPSKWAVGNIIVVNPPPDHPDPYWLAYIQSYSPESESLVVRWYDKIENTNRFQRSDNWLNATDTIVCQSVYEDLKPILKQTSESPKIWELANETEIRNTVLSLRQ